MYLIENGNGEDMKEGERQENIISFSLYYSIKDTVISFICND